MPVTDVPFCSITVAASSSSSSRCERLRQPAGVQPALPAPAVLRCCDCRHCVPLRLLHYPQSRLQHPPAAPPSSWPPVLSAVGAPAPSRRRRASSRRCCSHNSPLLRSFAAAIAASFVYARLHLNSSITPVPLLAALHEHASTFVCHSGAFCSAAACFSRRHRSSSVRRPSLLSPPSVSSSRYGLCPS